VLEGGSDFRREATAHAGLTGPEVSIQFVGSSSQFVRKVLTISACNRSGANPKGSVCSAPLGSTQSHNIYGRLVGSFSLCC